MRQTAKKIVDKFGGEYQLATRIGASPSTIYRWTYPLSVGGTDGIIPVKWHEKIKRAGRLEGILITDEDLSF